MEMLKAILLIVLFVVWASFSITMLISSVQSVIYDLRREKRDLEREIRELEYHEKRMESLK